MTGIKPKIIAFDGTSASGKGTIAKLVAKECSFDYLDSGVIFRQIAFLKIFRGIPISLENIVKECHEFDFSTVETQCFLTDNISDMASKLAKNPLVREAAKIFQKDYVKGKKVVVIDGRDIGTVIFPDAIIKFYFDADINVRAKRRFKQLHKEGKSTILAHVLESLKLRDLRDKTRSVAPLVRAVDSISIDSTSCDISEVLKKVLKNINEKLNLK